MAPASDSAPPAPSPTGLTVSILGCGAVGTALAAALSLERVPLVLWSRTAGRAAALAERLGREFAGAPEATLAPDAVDALVQRSAGPARVFVCVTDAVLEGFVVELAAALPAGFEAPRDSAVLHTHGARGLDLLAPLRDAGFAAAKLHPLVALPPDAASLRDAGQALREGWFATCATSGAEGIVAELVGLLGARSLSIAADDASSLSVHAAASLLSGGLVALFDAALGSLASSTPADDAGQASEALQSLLESTVKNLHERGPSGALTGPTARGAVEVVRAHLERLSALDPQAAGAYRVLARRMLELGRRRGSVEAAAATALERLLAD